MALVDNVALPYYIKHYCSENIIVFYKICKCHYWLIVVEITNVIRLVDAKRKIGW